MTENKNEMNIYVNLNMKYICVIDQACSVKMAGYCPSSFLRFYGPRRSRGPLKRKKERGQYPAILTEQAWSIKDLLYSQNITQTEFRFCGTNAGNLERAR